MTKKNLLSISLFIILGLFALQIPFSNLLGANVKFTLFDFLAPTFGAFIGTFPGILTVFAIQILNIFVSHTSLNAGIFIRLFPTLFGVYYFSQKRSFNVFVPILAIVAFNLHPIGRSAWQYSLFWLIPIAAHFYRKNLFVKSLGATFTAHAVGGALWIWAFGLSREIWLALIPQVMMERLAMAGGVSIFYLVIHKAIQFLSANKPHPAFS